MQMINHGLSSAALFLLVGMIYERYHTRQITEYSGMAAKMPLFALFLVFMCMSSAGLPGLNGLRRRGAVPAGRDSAHRAVARLQHRAGDRRLCRHRAGGMVSDYAGAALAVRPAA